MHWARWLFLAAPTGNTPLRSGFTLNPCLTSQLEQISHGAHIVPPFPAAHWGRRQRSPVANLGMGLKSPHGPSETVPVSLPSSSRSVSRGRRGGRVFKHKFILLDCVGKLRGETGGTEGDVICSRLRSSSCNTGRECPRTQDRPSPGQVSHREDGAFQRPEPGFAELEKRLGDFSLQSACLQQVLLGFKETLRLELGSDTGCGTTSTFPSGWAQPFMGWGREPAAGELAERQGLPRQSCVLLWPQRSQTSPRGLQRKGLDFPSCSRSSNIAGSQHP
ncbi:uncharacterized protein LOC127039438 [Gopherus flavomarginatus]|uniref:uncharacterized protein LOC127039438 n=1 Tax=Gopherus flavomarginatus TaxID=286002 RepID=UPI0021CBFAF0|nr:uncharacterized protein LOC127039438 [Gopherus flavomarginatus]